MSYKPAAGPTFVAGAWRFTRISRTALFWTAFILICPLGATVGDPLDKAVSDRSLAAGPFTASAVLAVLILGCILVLPQRAGGHAEGRGDVTGEGGDAPAVWRHLPLEAKAVVLSDPATVRL